MQALVPYLDLANHAPGAPTSHGIEPPPGADQGASSSHGGAAGAPSSDEQLDSNGSSCGGAGSSGGSGGGHRAGEGRGSTEGWYTLYSSRQYAAGEEVVICYGEKGNRLASCSEGGRAAP